MVNRLRDFWSNLTEKRSADSGMRMSFLGASSTTTVTEETAMKLSAVYACIKVISESVAKLPLHVYETSNGSRQVAQEHPAYRLLYSDPNP